jgi:hypothetical protein
VFSGGLDACALRKGRLPYGGLAWSDLVRRHAMTFTASSCVVINGKAWIRGVV